MRAVMIKNPGADSQLEPVDVDIPVCGEQQILIKVKAAAVNRADLLQRRGKYPPPPGESAIPGLEAAGEVAEVGSAVKQFKKGDQVYGLTAGGGYAEYCLLHQQLAAIIPAGWDHQYAVALPEALLTAHAAIVQLGQLKAGQTLLIHGAGSGISCLGIQMAKVIGATVISTVSQDEKILRAKQLGVDSVINYKKEDFSELVETDSVDLIIDYIGGDYFTKHLKLLKTNGIMVQIACMLGHKVELNLAQLMQKRLQLKGFVLRSQTINEKAALWQAAHTYWSTALLTEAIKPVIDFTFDFNHIEQAHARMQNGQHFGKIIIEVD